jgi:ABC-type transport system substrate-binding protein
LHDAEFRHALIHCYDQLGIIPPIYGYTVTPVRSKVPPSQGPYYNPNVPTHPYNPGDPFTSTPSDHDSCGILKAAGYTFVDVGSIGVVDSADYWKMPNGDLLDRYVIWTPLVTDAPTSYEHVARFVRDLGSIGLAATTANGLSGLINEGVPFNEYLQQVYDFATFDAFFVAENFGKFPEQLHLLLHSSQDSLTYPGRRNAPGVNDPLMDALCETVKYSLDPNDAEAAAKQIQEEMYDPTLLNADNFALAYICMYTKTHFNSYNPNLRCIVKSGGYGSDNKWTFLNIEWAPGTARLEDVYGDSAPETVVKWVLGQSPDNFNSLYAGVYDGLVGMNPYNHYDIPWIASDWTIIETTGGMEISFTLSDDVYWQDGYLFDAYDVEFCLELLRDFSVPRYVNPCETLVDVAVLDATHCTIEVNEAGLALFYGFAGLGALLPRQIWDRPWANLAALLAYAPEAWAYGTDMAPGYAAGPWASQVSTNLFGTGPWIFQFYDTVNEYAELWANRDYFLTQADVHTLKADMFWEVGDRNKDGVVDVIDLTFVSFAYGTNIADGIPPFDPQADFNSDNWVDIKDLSNCAYHLLWQKEYP